MDSKTVQTFTHGTMQFNDAVTFVVQTKNTGSIAYCNLVVLRQVSFI